MKILHLTDDLGLLGGVQSYLRDVGGLLDESGIESLTWAPTPGIFGGQISRWAGLGHRRRVRALIAREKPDVVHAHNLWMRLSPGPLKAAKEAGIPVVMTVHDYTLVCPNKWMVTSDDRPCEKGFGSQCLVWSCRGSKEGLRWQPYKSLRWAKTSFHRRMLRKGVDQFISPSGHLSRWLETSLGVERVLHIPNFARGPRGGKAVPVSRPETLLFAGRLSREKGVEVILKAMPEIRKRCADARLVIAGDGPERSTLETLAVTLEIDDMTHFVGSLGPEALDQQYQEAGVVVLPTVWMENCPVSVLEAQAHGRAVVATRIGGVPELIEEGQTGLLFDKGDHRQLADKISQLLLNPKSVESMGLRASRWWATRFTPEIHRQRLQAAYQSVMAGR